ncbi:hypothetical protein B0H11DRAFT_2263891 [Mycena galericulata]|nr:hypothetical protein B0H11DRAFT_2263891 [Mycena galericulata]
MLRVSALRVCALLRLCVCALRLCAPILYFGSHPAWGGVVVHRDFVAHPSWGGCGCPLRVCALLRLRVCALRLCAPVLYFGSHPAWGGCRCAPRLRCSSHVGWARLPPACLCAVMFARLCAVTSARLCACPVLRLSSRVGWVSLCTATSLLIPRGVGAVAPCASVRCYVCASVRCASVRPSCTSALILRGVGVVVHRDFVAHPTWGGRGCPLRVCALLRLRVCALRLRAPVLYFGSHPAWGGCRCAPRLCRSSHMGWVRLPSARPCAVTFARQCAHPVLQLSSTTSLSQEHFKFYIFPKFLANAVMVPRRHADIFLSPASPSFLKHFF